MNYRIIMKSAVSAVVNLLSLFNSHFIQTGLSEQYMITPVKRRHEELMDSQTSLIGRLGKSLSKGWRRQRKRKISIHFRDLHVFIYLQDKKTPVSSILQIAKDNCPTHISEIQIMVQFISETLCQRSHNFMEQQLRNSKQPSNFM